MTVRRVLPYLAIVAVAGGLIWAFTALGTPAHARQVSLDRMRVRNIYQIASVMHDRFGKGNTLPVAVPADIVPADDHGTPYTYQRANRNTYRLCANFELAYRPTRPTDRSWTHPAGHSCFSFDVRNDAIEPNDVDGGPTGGSPPF